MTGLADPNRSGLLETTDPNDPRPINFPGQGDWMRVGGWLLFTCIGGGVLFFVGLSLIIDRPGPVATPCGVLLLLAWPCGLVLMVRSMVHASRSTDVYAGTEDGVRTARELREWEAREASRRQDPQPPPTH